MRRAKRIVFAFGPFGEAGQPAALAQCADAVASAGQDLVRMPPLSKTNQGPVFKTKCFQRLDRISGGLAEQAAPQDGSSTPCDNAIRAPVFNFPAGRSDRHRTSACSALARSIT